MRHEAISALVLCLIGVILLSCTSRNLPQKIATVSEISDPYQIMWTAKNRLFITDSKDSLGMRTNIYVYSLEDFRLQNQFGGREVFQIQPAHSIFLFMLPDRFAVNSSGKVSVFDYDYNLIKESEHQKDSFFYAPLGNNYIARQVYYENKVGYYRINFYDSELKFLKELCRKEFVGRAFSGDFDYKIYNDKIYLAKGTEDFLIEVFDEDGNITQSIRHEYEKVPVTKRDKDEHMNALLSRPGWERYFKSKVEMEQYYKKLIKYPEYFPAITNHILDGDKIYVLTRRQVHDKREIFIFDLEGKIIDRKLVSFTMRSNNIWNPMTIHDNHLLQLIKNENTGKWELYKTKIL